MYLATNVLDTPTPDRAIPPAQEVGNLIASYPLYDQVMDEYAAAGKGSTERLLYSRRQLDPHFTGRRMDQVRRFHIRAYTNARLAKGVSPSTINRELDDFSAAVNHWSFVYEVPLANPCAGMSLPMPEGRVRWITRQEATRLIIEARARTSTPHLAAFVQLALHTGCRKNELLRLDIGRVREDPVSGQIWIVLEGQHTKTKRQRLIPLNTSALGALELMRTWRAEHCPESPWVFPSPKNWAHPIWKMDRRFKEACARAGIDDFRIHDLRHTFASWLVMAGRPLQVVRDLLGHSSIQMTERYAHLAPDHMVGAVESLAEILPSQFPISQLLPSAVPLLHT